MTNEIVPQKACSVCRRSLPALPEYYDRQAQGKFGVTSVCKECQGREFGIHLKRADKTEKAKLEAQGLRRCLQCNEVHPLDFFGGRYCKICRRKYDAKRREIKHDEIREYRQQWTAQNRDKLNEKRRARWQANPEHYRLKHRIYSVKRRYRIRMTETDITPQFIEEMFERQNRKCYWCNKKLTRFEVDHIMPLARGGKHIIDNVCCACVKCNRSKGAKTLQEWGRLC